MSYMNVIPVPNFEPGDTTKKFLYYVKKAEYRIGTTTMPGLLQDTGFDWLNVLFVIALVLEAIGLLFIIDEIGLGFWQGMMSVSFLIMLDIFFAFLLHLKTKTICRFKNEIAVLPLIAGRQPSVVSGDQLASVVIAARTKLWQSKIAWAKIGGFFVALVIWAIAGTKIISFYALASMGSDGVDTKAFLIITTYIIVAIIHIYFTGYVLFGWIARYYWKRDENARAKYVHNNQPGQYQAMERSEYIITTSPMPDTILINSHKLEKLLSVDLIYRDREQKARLLLGETMQTDLSANVRKRIEGEYAQQKGKPQRDLQNYRQAIEEKVNTVAEEMKKIEVDMRTYKGIVNTDMKMYLRDVWQVDQSMLDRLETGQALYRIVAKGMLLDTELSAMAEKVQNNDAKNIIAIYGLDLQLKIVHMDA